MMTSSAGRGAPVKRVDDSLLKSGVAIMPGGEDQLGRPLVAFPTTTPEMLRQRHTTAHLVLLLRYYVTLTDVTTRHGGMAVIANLTTYGAKDGLQMVVDALDKLQSEICGSVGVLYVILPRSKDAQKTLKKLLGLKPSKKHPKIPTYEAVLLETVADLQRHIQRRHLTSDFGGTMTYNHRIWVQLTQDVEDLQESVTSALHRVPDAVDKVTMMSEYDLPASPSESEALLLQVRSKYNDIMRHINLEHLIDECKSLQDKLSAPHKHEGYNDITHTVTFTDSKVKVIDYRNRLVQARENLKSLWQQAEGRVMLASKVNKYKVKAEKVTEWMQGVGLPTVNQDPDIADCLSKAEILKNHFETGFLAIAKNVLCLAERILKKFEHVLQECGPIKPFSSTSSSPRGTHQVQTAAVLAYTRQFQATVEYFKRAVEKKHQVYLNVHAFFLSAVKLTKWYRRTLKFLPVQLLIPASRVAGPRPTSASPYVSSAWRAAIQDFLLHHPLPPADSLTKMKNVIPVIDNIGIRNQARLLIARITLIRSLLVTPDHLSLHDLQDVLLWREQVTKGQDEIYLNMITSTRDLSCLTDSAYNKHVNQGNLRERQWHMEAKSESTLFIDSASMRTPKLCLNAGNEKMYFDEQLAEHPNHGIAHSKKHVHLASIKKGRNKDQQDSVGYLQSEHNIHAVGQSHAPPGVPRLDLRGLKSPVTQKSHTDRDQIFKRQPSFGIYGHVDDPKKVVHRRRTGRCVQNLAPILNSNDNGTEAQQADKELYVSLGGAETSPGSLRLPVSLKHIDIHAFKKNLPQANEHENETIPTTSLSYNGEHRNGRPHSYESLVDSGIAHTQSSAEGSGVSDSTNGLSPSLSVGHGRMDTLLEDNEQDPEQSHEHWAQGHDPRIRSHGPKVQGHGHMGHDQQGHSTHQSHNHKGQSQVANGLSHSPLHQAQSLQNLSYELNGRLSLTQKNIDIIVNSLLPAEEKLKLMVTMCECEGMHNRRAVADAVNALPLRKDSIKRASEVQENNIEPELQHQGGTMSSRLADVLSDSYLQNSSLRSSQGDVTAQNVSGSHSSRARTPKLTGAKLFESHSASPHPEQLGLSLKDSLEPQKYHIIHQNQVNPQQHHIIHQTQVHHQQHNIIHQNQDLTTNVPQIQNGRQPGPTEALLLAQHEDVFGGHVAHENYSVLGNDVHDAGLGIDIEAWMMNQEDGSSEVLLTELAESDQTVDGMSEYVEKWKHARENRQSDEEELSKAARAALKDLSVQEEQLKQQAVERSLTRTQQLLQKQEEHLQKKQIHMTAAADEVPVSSECSLSSGTSAAAVGVTGSFSSDSLPHPSASIHLQENTFCHSSGSSSPPRDVYDSSVSGESGVFTLNSSDTRLIKAAHADMAYSGGSSPRVHKGLSSSAGAVLIPQAELLQGRAALAKSFNGRDAASSKSGILKQMDFRDMLKSISAECNVDDDDGQEEEEEEEEEKDQKVENKEEEEEMGHDDGLHCEEFKEVMQIALDNNLSRSDIDVAIEQCQPIPVLCRLPDSGMNMNGSFNECPGKVMVKETTHGLQKSIPAYSDSDMSDDVFSSDNSTPVNSPRTSSLSQSLKKWDSLNLLEIQEDKLSKPQKDLNENFAGEDGLLTTNTIDIELNACNTVLVGEELVHNSKCVTTNIIPKTMHDNTPTKVHDTRIRSMSDGLEITEFADMKVKVAAGGGSAWANAIPITSYSMEFANLKTPVIIDNGSGLCKCGFADQDLPSAIFPALVGRAKYEDVSMGRMEEHYVGAAAQSMRGVLKLQHPLEHGIITDWNGMELIWQHAFEEQLRVDPSEHPVLVTEAPLNPKKNREHMMELLFETFQVPGVYFAIQAVLSLYASGRTTGMVVDSGDGVSHFVPIYEGYSLPHAIQRLDVAGRDLTQYMAKLLYEKGHSFTSTAETEIVRDMKEKHCYITQDYCADMQRAETSSDMEELYMLPDGQYISLTAERFRCPEVLFDPTMIGHEHGGVHVSAYKSIMKCDLDLREQLFSNIVLSGGTTMLPGFGERLQEEVTALAPSGVAGSVRVTSPEDRYFSVWQGGAVLASLPTFQDCWVSFEEYIDVGANVVHLKCF